jgi:hypothetical protein
MQNSELLLIVYVLLIHWVSDFVFQNRWMAENKSKTFMSLNAHVSAYTFAMIIGLCGIGYWKIFSILQFCLLNMILHWFTDYLTSKASAYYKAKKNVHSFFCVIGFDQFIHTSCLILTTSWILLNDTSRITRTIW